MTSLRDGFDAAPVHRHAGQHLATGRAGLVRLLPEQVLDAKHIRERQVAMVAEQLLGERLPADDRATVDLGDLAQLVRAGGRAQLAWQFGADEDRPPTAASARPP